MALPGLHVPVHDRHGRRAAGRRCDHPVRLLGATSITSFLLIAYKTKDEAARQGAFKSLFITGGGGIALLAGLLFISSVAGNTDYTTILTSGDVLRAQPALRRDAGTGRVRCVHQERTGARAHLAARRHDRANPCQRVPALRHHGQGRHLSAGAHESGAGPDRYLVLAAHQLRADHHAGRRIPGAEAKRPEGTAGLLHRQPARRAGDADRRRHAAGIQGAGDQRGGACVVQIGPLPDRGHRGSRDGDARPAPVGRVAPRDAADLRRGRRGCALHGRLAAHVRLPCQGDVAGVGDASERARHRQRAAFGGGGGRGRADPGPGRYADLGHVPRPAARSGDPRARGAALDDRHAGHPCAVVVSFGPAARAGAAGGFLRQCRRGGLRRYGEGIAGVVGRHHPAADPEHRGGVAWDDTMGVPSPRACLAEPHAGTPKLQSCLHRHTRTARPRGLPGHSDAVGPTASLSGRHVDQPDRVDAPVRPHAAADGAAAV